MMKIGTFKKYNDELVGVLTLKGIPLNVKIIPVLNKAGDRHPDHKIYGSKDDLYDIDLGAAWNQKDIDLLSGKEMPFISATIDHMSLPSKIYFNLFQVENDNWEARSRERQK